MPEEHRGRALPENLIRWIRRLRRQGLPMRDVASIVGVSLWAVQKYDKLPLELRHVNATGANNAETTARGLDTDAR